jgi:hypothetical protein
MATPISTPTAAPLRPNRIRAQTPSPASATLQKHRDPRGGDPCGSVWCQEPLAISPSSRAGPQGRRH